VEGSCDPVEFTLDRNNVSLLIESVDQRDGKLVGNGIHGEKVIMAYVKRQLQVEGSQKESSGRQRPLVCGHCAYCNVIDF
jgi:hypothetical protein